MKNTLLLFVLAAMLGGCSGGGGDTKTVVGADGSKVTTSDKGATIETADGQKATLGASAVSEAELGYPFYPGSTEVTGADLKMEADGKQTFSSFRETKDSVDKVLDFYKSKVEKPDTAAVSGEMAMLIKDFPDGTKLAISAMPNVETKLVRVNVSVSRPIKK